MSGPPPSRRVRFGAFELDTRTGELWKSGRRLRVRDQPIQILQALLERAGDVVTREELRDRLWPADTFVDFEHGLNSAVRRLRDALGDSADRPKFIETLPRLGYRFIGRIETDDPARADAPAPDDAPPHVPPTAAGTAHSSRRPWIVAVATLLALTLSAAALSGRWSERRDPPAAWSEPERLTFEDGLQTNPVFSPDSQSLAYAGDASGNFDIWTRRLGGGNPVQITTHPAHDWQPDWSPDGNAIAFRSERGTGGIFVVPATGGVERQLTNFGHRPQWSPDGRWILFATSILSGGGRGLHVVGPNDDGAPRPLETPGTGAFGWLPDSQEAIVLSGHRLPVAIAIVSTNVETGRHAEWTFDDTVMHAFRRQALAVPGGERLYWSADGRSIFFIGEALGLPSVWRIDVDATTRRVVGGPLRVTGTSRDANNFSLSPDGRHLAFDGSTRTARLWSYALDETGNVRAGSEQPASREAVHAELPDLSPDGRRLVSVQAQPGSRQRRELLDRDMTTGRERVLRVIDDARETIAFARWNTAGSRLSYMHFTQSVPDAIQQRTWLLDPETGGTVLVTSPASADERAPALVTDWTPDDRFLVSVGGRAIDGRLAIALLPVARSPHADAAATTITSADRGPIYQASVSPDGRWIAFRAPNAPGHRGGRLAIAGAQAPGTDESSWINATRPELAVDKPRWSTAGDRIYFSANDGAFYSIWSIGFDSDRGQLADEPREVIAFNSPGAHILPDARMFELALGGNRLVVPVVRPKGGIWIAEREAR